MRFPINDGSVLSNAIERLVHVWRKDSQKYRANGARLVLLSLGLLELFGINNWCVCAQWAVLIF